MNPLSAPWRAALEEAWTAYLEGSLPIGACVADASGRVLSVGRNRLGEPRRVDGVIGGHDLGHAEINALLSLHDVPRPDCYGWAVYTTVEPCPQCMGAVTMSGVRSLHYAAADPWAGSADLLTSHPYMVRKGMRVGRARMGWNGPRCCSRRTRCWRRTARIRRRAPTPSSIRRRWSGRQRS